MIPTIYTTEALFCVVSVMLCFLTGGILLFFSAGKPRQFLGLSYLVYGIALTVIRLSAAHPLYQFPHLYRTANIFFLLYMPLSYLYVRSSIRQKPLTAWDLVHLLPVILYVVDYFPFFLLSGAHKVAIFSEELNDLDQLLQFREGWLLPANFHFPIRLILMAFYWILQVQLLASREAAWIRKDIAWLRWQYIYNALQLPIFLPALIMVLTGSHLNYFWTCFPPAGASLLSALTLLMYPRILYNIGLTSGARAKPVPNGASTQQLRRRMETYMREEKPFLDPNYAIRELADAMEITLHKLSAYLNRETGKNFSDYVNQWRIEYCLESIRDRKFVNLNLNGIATKCGFNNRNTFSTAFKKITGSSPSLYMQMTIGN